MAEYRQLSFFGIEPRPLAGEDTDETRVDVADPLPRAAPPLPGQIDLFADRVCVSRDLDAALGDGDFAEARRLRRLLEETYGGSTETKALLLIEDPTVSLSDGQPEARLSAWRVLDSRLEAEPRLRRLVRQGFFRRLLREHSAEEVAARDPEALPDLAAALASSPDGSAEEEWRRARSLVRDALRAGHHLDPLGFRWDESLFDLLAEDEPPLWMACLGAIRRLWQTRRLTSEESALLSAPFQDPGSPEDVALAFWSCLAAANDPDCPEDLLREARRRMKKLRPDLHALYMRRARA